MTLRASTGAGIQTSNISIGAGSQDSVTYTLGSFAFGGNTHVSSLIGQTTTAITTAKTIITVPNDGASLTVTGTDGTNRFTDMILASLPEPPAVAVTHTIAGAPTARTYTNAGAGVIQLAMASGTYSVAVFGTVCGQR